jgi:hypothetical protein
MSHFTVLIIGENVEQQLEPYYELECSMDQNEMRNDSRAEFVEEKTEEEMEQDFLKVKDESPDLYYENIEEFAEDYYGYIKENDMWGRYTNTNSKWDWYSIGGRWTGVFKLKENPKYSEDAIIGSPGLMTEKAKSGYVDSARICDIDFEGMKKEKLEKLEKNWIEIEKNLANNDQTVYWTYDVKEGDTKESYIERNSGFSTYAVLRDDEWYEKGEMGWWGVSTNENDNWQKEFNKLISSLSEDTLITIVDCHI